MSYLLIVFTFLGASILGTAHAQGEGGHAQHQTPATQAAAKPATAADTSGQYGPWSYLGRKNPEPWTKNRWDMVPGEGNTATFVATDTLTREQRCAALKKQTTMAIDRATRKECGLPLDPRAQEADRKSPAGGHGGHNMSGMAGGAP